MSRTWPHSFVKEKIEKCNYSPQGHDQESLGRWSNGYQADYDFAVATCQKYAESPIWHPEMSLASSATPPEKIPVSQVVPVP
jgi:hypothetical protein